MDVWRADSLITDRDLVDLLVIVLLAGIGDTETETAHKYENDIILVFFGISFFV